MRRLTTPALAALILWLSAAETRADETETEIDLGVVGWWPDLAVGPDGAVHLVYARCRPCAVRYRVWRDGWSAEENVPGSSNVSNDDVNSPRVAVDEAGRVHVVWAEDIRTDNAPWYARLTEAGWESAVRVSNDANEDIEGLDVEAQGDTVYVAANVLDPDVTPPTGPGSETRLYARAAGGSGGFTSQRLGDQGKDVRLFRGDDGALYVLYWWIQWRFDRFLGFRLHHHEASAWSDELALPTDSLPEDSPGQASLCADPAGAVTLAFAQWTGSTPARIYIREPDGAFVPVSDAAPNADSPPALTRDSQGNRYVVWADGDGRLRFSNSLFWRPTWAPEAIFPTLTDVEQVAIATAGEANHLVWRDPDTRRLHHNRRLIRRDDAAVAAHTIPASLTLGDSADAVVRMRNTGTLPWPASGAWQLAAMDDSDPLATGLRVAPTAEVPAGAEHDFAIHLVAPSESGVYTTDWHMVREGAYPFGPTLSVRVEVSAAAEDLGVPPGDVGSAGDAGDAGGTVDAASDSDEPRPDFGPLDGSVDTAGGPAEAHDETDSATGASPRSGEVQAGCGCGSAHASGGGPSEGCVVLALAFVVGMLVRPRGARRTLGRARASSR